MEHNPIHTRLKKKRKELGLTQVEFAKRSGVGLRFLRELEGGKPTIRLDKLNKVLEFLGLKLELTPATGIKSKSEKEG